jgi:hypothetical protein
VNIECIVSMYMYITFVDFKYAMQIIDLNSKVYSYRQSVQVNDKILYVPKMWQNERLQPKNDYKCCNMITNTLDMIIIAT